MYTQSSEEKSVRKLYLLIPVITWLVVGCSSTPEAAFLPNATTADKLEYRAEILNSIAYKCTAVHKLKWKSHGIIEKPNDPEIVILENNQRINPNLVSNHDRVACKALLTSYQQANQLLKQTPTPIKTN